MQFYIVLTCRKLIDIYICKDFCLCVLLCLVVPDADRAVQRAGGYEGLAYADGQPSDGAGVEGLGQELKV